MGSTPPPSSTRFDYIPPLLEGWGKYRDRYYKNRDSRFQIKFFMSYITKRSRFTYFGIHSLLILYICFCLFWRELSP